MVCVILIYFPNQMNLDLFSDSYIKIARSSMHFEPAVWAMKGDLRWTSSRQDYWSRGLLLGWSWSKQCSSCHRSCLRRDCLHVFQNLRCPSFSNISQICQGPELFVCQEMLLVSSRFLKTFYLYTQCQLSLSNLDWNQRSCDAAL